MIHLILCLIVALLDIAGFNMSLLNIIVKEEKNDMQEMAETAARKNEIEEVAKVIAAEAAGEGEEGMRAVASVIMNRANNKSKSPIDIVTSKNQFYGYTAKNKDKLYKQVKDIAYKLAEDIYSKKLKDTVKGAEYFLLPNEKVRSWHGEPTVKIGKHQFYKESNRRQK